MAEPSEDPKLELSLSLITSLGGNKEDLDLIEDVSDNEEAICIKEDFNEYKDEALPKKELQMFIKSLGFNKLKKKLLVIKDDDVDDKEIAESIQKPQNEGDEPPVPKEKKPRGNKFKQNLDNDQKSQIQSRAAVLSQNLSKLSEGPPKEHKIRNYMLVKPNRKWFESEIAVDAVHHHVFIPSSKISDYEQYALELLQSDICLYKKHQGSLKNRSNFSWIQTVLKSGTSADKMAAYIVLLQDSPVHNLTTLENLIRLVDVKKKRECLLAVDTLKDLFTVDLLLESRKLTPFNKQPLGSLDQLANGNRDSYDKLLLLWYFESCLKQRYSQFVTALFKMAHDNNLSTKRKALKTMFDLLSSNPEQEQSLLSNLVNKLGDPHRKIASHCGLLLCRVVDIHPPMKAVLVAEVERLLFRSGISPKAVYYAICFLNQLILNPEDKELAAKLVSIYFSLFKAATKTGEVESKMMSALLTGVNRAFPYAKPEADTIECHINITYKIVHTTHFNVAVQALMLIYHVLDSKDEFSDRFYSALYRKLLDSELKHSSKQAMFLNLLYKSLKKDLVNHRVHAFLKRILQIAPEQSAGMICGLLFIVSEVLANSSCKLMLHSKEEDLDDEEEKFNDISDEENGGSGPKPELRRSENGINDSETGVKTATESSWVHRVNLTQGQNPESTVETCSTYTYDPLHRNPLFAGAIRTCAWELIQLMHHYHPSVAMFATNLLNSERIAYTGDPLQDFTLIRFLDRFVYRNPKKLSVKGEESSQRAILGRRKHYVPVGAKAHAINTNRFLQHKESAIPVDEKFFYRYFAKLKEMDVKRKTPMDEDDEDIESVASDEFEMLLNKFEPGSLKDEYDLDFATEVKSKSEESKRKKGKGKSSDNQEEDDSEDYEDDDEEFHFDGDDEFTEAFKDFDDDIADACKSDPEEDFDEDMDFSEEILQKPKGLSAGSHSKRNSDQNSVEDETFLTDDDDDDDDDDDFDDNDSIDEIEPVVKKRKSSKKVNPNELFASAEEFSAMLDENIGADKDTIGLEALSNRDNAHAKQLHWEQERDRWIRGVDWRKKLRNKKSKSRKPNGRPVLKGSKRKRK